MIRTCEIKLGRSAKADDALLAVLDDLRRLYNACLEQRIDAWRKQRKSVSRYDQQKELTVLRGADPVYAALPAEMTRATVTTRLDLAFKAFFRRCKAGQTPGFPRFRGRDRFDTLVFGTQSWRVDGKWLVLNIGATPIRLRMKNAPHRQGTIKGLRLVRKGERWWAQIITDVGEAPVVQRSTHGVGIDVGIKTFASMSDGTQVRHPHFIRRSADGLRTAQQAVSRCKRGSRRRAKARSMLTRKHWRVANQRRDFVRQTSAELVRRYDGFAIEDLDVQEMTDSERPPPEGMGRTQACSMRRNIMDSAWTMFHSALACKAEEAGMPFVRVNPRGTTQRCSGCGSLVRKSLRDRTHSCAACGLVMDRDENAARNIFDLGDRSAPGLLRSCAEGGS